MLLNPSPILCRQNRRHILTAVIYYTTKSFSPAPTFLFTLLWAGSSKLQQVLADLLNPTPTVLIATYQSDM